MHTCLNIKSAKQRELNTYRTINAINKEIKEPERFKAIIVCFDNEGCLMYSQNKRKLFFYPKEIEGDFVLENGGKRVSSTITTLQASLTYALAHKRVTDDIEKEIAIGIKNGLVAMRHLVDIGFTKEGEYRYDIVAKIIKKTPPPDGENDNDYLYPVDCEIPNTIEAIEENSFSFMNETLKNKSNEVLFDICKDIVTYGRSSKMEAKVIPFLRYKKLVTYDKYEITQLRNVHNSVRSYINDKTKAKPLSICVFGAPGSGKSFTVKQITQDVDKNGKTETIHFNLSQLKGPEELRQVFHQIRDVGLKGDLPIAFFDEFDTKTEGSGTFSWLKHFLAPMEDGVFIDNGRSHIIGRAIFIFAGGTYDSAERFRKDAFTDNDRGSKARDFASRVEANIDIFGPNDRKCIYNDGELKNENKGFKNVSECYKLANKLRSTNTNKKTKNLPSTDDPVKAAYVGTCPFKHEFCYEKYTFRLRRATLLRSILETILEQEQDSKIPVTDEVLKAFIYVDEYLNGARSLQAIVQTSKIVKGKPFSVPCINTSNLNLFADKTFAEILNGEIDDPVNTETAEI